MHLLVVNCPDSKNCHPEEAVSYLSSRVSWREYYYPAEAVSCIITEIFVGGQKSTPSQASFLVGDFCCAFVAVSVF